MSFEELLIHTVTIFNPEDAGTTNRYGDPQQDESAGVVVKARVQPAMREELLENRDTRLSRFRVFLLPDAPVTGLSVLVWGDHELHVTGEPQLFYDATAAHHYELDAEEALG